MSWVVIDESNAVYSAWVEECAPSLEEEAEMLSWFDYLEDQDASPLVDGQSDEGLPLTTAPNGEDVAFVLVHNPDPRDEVRGAVVLRHIGCHG